MKYLILFLMLGACSMLPSSQETTRNIEVVKEDVDLDIYHPDMPSSLEPPDVEVQVLTKDVALARIDEGIYEIIYGFNEEDYLDLSQYFQNVNERILKYKQIIIYYREETGYEEEEVEE